MLRLTDIKLPLNHSDNAIEQAILQKLEITKHELVDFTVFKRGYDARKKSNIVLIYTLDVNTTKETVLLEQFSKDSQVKLTPDMAYKFVAH